MPINKTVAVSQEIRSITFNDSGDMSVTLKVTGETPLPDVTHQISLKDTSAIIDAETAGMTIRQSIVFGVYQYLIESGKVTGEITA